MSLGPELSSDVSVGLKLTAMLGALPLGDDRCAFRVWAPHANRVELQLLDPDDRRVPLQPQGRGYHAAIVADVHAGTRYRWRLDDGAALPDPASRCQPDGVHGSSAVVAADFDWRSDDWSGLPLEEYVIYELHVGSFTAEGTFDAAAQRLPELAELGVTAVELMPVAQFPGERNWGYDGVFPYAAQNSYGGPVALKRFVDRCHELGLAAVLDVVYNHLGPDGNYLRAFGPYFVDKYHTPWGDALNFDGPFSDEVREYFIRNALQWTIEFRFDALRLDAVHAIVDMSAQPFLRQLADRVHAAASAAGRTVLLIAESNLNDPRVIRTAARGGLGMDALWLDDLHHALHAVLTGERAGYYADYGSVEHLARCYRHAFAYAGEFSEYHARSYGAPAPDARPAQFVVCSQNHDQIGNRLRGERLTALVDLESLKLAAAAAILSPFTPLLFMGEEYAEPAPFPYFVSHSDPLLIEAVRKGRRAEFAAFAWAGEPPDPQATSTYASARLNPALRERSPHAELYAYYRELIALRRELPRHDRVDAPTLDVRVLPPEGRVVTLLRRSAERRALVVLNFDTERVTIAFDELRGVWRRRLDSAAERWAGSGSRLPERFGEQEGSARFAMPPRAAAVFTSEGAAQ